LIDFQDSFTDRLRTKFSIKLILYSPPHLTEVATLPCETAMFQKSYKFKNTLSKDVVLKYFCGCTCLISFSRQNRVSIKNYEILVHIKYSVRDLIYDIHVCMSRNKRKIKQTTSALHLVTINFSKLWIPIHIFF